MLLWNKIENELRGDRVIWMILIVLSIFSILAVYSSTSMMGFEKRGGNTEFYLFKHGIFILAGIGFTYLCYKIPYRNYLKLAPWLLSIAIPLLIITFFLGTEVNDARRWITIPGVGLTFQTSDFAKLALIVYLARSITSKQDIINSDFWAAVPIIAPIIMVCILIAPSDLSTAALLFIVSLLMLIIGRVSGKFILWLLVAMMVFFSILIIAGTFLPEMIRLETWVNRITEFWLSEEGGYQIQQAKIAIADGEWFGVGPGQSIQKNYLPAPYSDFIFAIICEEYGLLGGFFIIGLYLLFFARCVSIITRSPKTFGAMLVVGMGLLIVVQAFANMAVSVHLVPVTGLTLPMVSMGGTSILSTSVAVGIILSVSKYIEKKPG